jgi:nitrogen fixation protein NifB
MENTAEQKTNNPVRVAVTTYEGLLINQHLGMADLLWIYEMDKAGSRLIERRRTPPRGSGDDRWQEISRLLHDCTVLLTGGLGERPLEVLSARGIKVYEAEGMIEDALIMISSGKDLRMPHRKNQGCRRGGMGLSGEGCG